MATKIRIDDVLDRLYAKFALNACTSWKMHLKGTTPGTYQNMLKWFGMRIPRQCWFKKTFNLSWTPCKLNPFFEHLIELSCWAHDKKHSDYLDKLYKELGVSTYGSEED